MTTHCAFVVTDDGEATLEGQDNNTIVGAVLGLLNDAHYTEEQAFHRPIFLITTSVGAISVQRVDFTELAVTYTLDRCEQCGEWGMGSTVLGRCFDCMETHVDRVGLMVGALDYATNWINENGDETYELAYRVVDDVYAWSIHIDGEDTDLTYGQGGTSLQALLALKEQLQKIPKHEE